MNQPKPTPFDLRTELVQLADYWLDTEGKKIPTSAAIDGIRDLLRMDEENRRRTAGVTVVPFNSDHEPTTHGHATRWERDEDGALLIFTEAGDEVARYSPHSWLSVVLEADQGTLEDVFTSAPDTMWQVLESMTIYVAAEDIREGAPLDLRDGKAWAITEDDVKGEGARFYPERLACSKGDPVEYVHIAEHNPERDAGRLICGVHEYGRGDNLAVPCGPNGPFAHFSKGPDLRVIHHYVQGAGSIADCGRGFTGSGPEVGFTDDWSAVTCRACRACPACREKLEGNRAAESTENRGSTTR